MFTNFSLWLKLSNFHLLDGSQYQIKTALTEVTIQLIHILKNTFLVDFNLKVLEKNFPKFIDKKELKLPVNLCK